jgi:tetratricopeptide (TPR) repeat protein
MPRLALSLFSRQHLQHPVRTSIRKALAVLLFVVALVPLGLIVGSALGSPQAVYATATIGGFWLTRIGWIAVSVFVLGVIAYPPFLPFLRYRIRDSWKRLGTDKGPMFEGIARLRHLETHADRLLVGRIARQLGDTATAVENLGRAYELDPTHVAGRYQLALLLIEIGQRADAVNLLATVLQEDEKHAFGDALLHAGKNLFRLHRDAEALAALRRHQAVFPGSRQVHLLVARVLADTGQMAAAREELKLAARPPGDQEHMSLEENLARTQAKVTFLRKGKGE